MPLDYSLHLEWLMVLEPFVIRRDRERLKDRLRKRRITVQFCPADYWVENHQNSLTRCY